MELQFEGCGHPKPLTPKDSAICRCDDCNMWFMYQVVDMPLGVKAKKWVPITGTTAREFLADIAYER